MVRALRAHGQKQTFGLQIFGTSFRPSSTPNQSWSANALIGVTKGRAEEFGVGVFGQRHDLSSRPRLGARALGTRR